MKLVATTKSYTLKVVITKDKTTQEEVPVASVEEGDPEVTATDEEVAAVVRVEGDCS